MAWISRRSTLFRWELGTDVWCIEYDSDIPLEHQCSGSTINDLIDEVFADLQHHQGDLEYLVSRAILCPKSSHVDAMNDLILQRLDRVARMYHTIDSVDVSTDALYPTEFLNSLNISGLSPHKLTHKIGMVLILLRSISILQTWCSGTRLILRGFSNNYLKAEVATGDQAGKIVMLPRIPICLTSLPLNFKRRQFPVRPVFAITINKSQGQTLAVAGLYLPQPVFAHGKLYVAVSRESIASGLKTLSLDRVGNKRTSMKNVVYREI
ncbi:TPA: hypothetical protein N0F65_004633 [Lagenidium giganteum]|uniref:DNA helicase Pif1-like 2B domain-containing protein n=1 Tax=Lagenidium giganteum TaxID=4803 RepID=A0AAV2Z7L4_9STRA|nr:TPA: hypothetical protein N0F65_004633 [Lagenidium giganteum]